MKRIFLTGIRRLRHALRGAEGAEIAELAAVLPILAMFLFGILWFGRAFQIYTTVNRAAREAAEAAVARSCASCGNVAQTKTDIQTNVINPILVAGHLNPSQVQGYDIQDVDLNSGAIIVRGSEVTLNYPYAFRLNGVTCCPLTLRPIFAGITIRARAQAQKEN